MAEDLGLLRAEDGAAEVRASSERHSPSNRRWPRARPRGRSSSDVTATELLFDASDPYRPEPHGYRLSLATNAGDVLAARRLRHLVFAGDSAVGPTGIDRDEYDERGDHLIVRHRSGTGGATRAEAVATCRLLPPHSNDAAPRGSGLAADREFGLMPLEGLLDSAVEAALCCVHPDHRGGGAVSLLWAGIARYLHLTGYRYLLGCTSIDLSDGGATAAAFFDLARLQHLAPAEHRCRPRLPVPIGGLPRAAQPVIPPVLRGALRLGAVICGPPAFDEMSGSADFLLLLDLRLADRRQLRHFLGVRSWDG